jgi:hypothetical protein
VIVRAVQFVLGIGHVLLERFDLALDNLHPLRDIFLRFRAAVERLLLDRFRAGLRVG